MQFAPLRQWMLSLAALLSAIAPFSARGQALTEPEKAEIDKAVTATLTQTGIPSAQVAVVRDGKLVLVQAWGKASETMPVARPAMPYQIASNSKQFLAALILCLRDHGRLKLDDPVSKYVPGVTDGARITVRQLLSHTSGLQDFWPQDYLFPEMQTAVAPRDIVARWAHKPLDYAPGTRWQYSNTGYVVAGLVAEKAGDAPLWTLFTRYLFKPLRIRPLPLDETNRPGFAQGYHRYALGPVVVATPPARGWLWGAGELSMTAADLAKWDIARINRTLLTPRDWREQEAPAILADGTDPQYGLGVTTRVTDGRRIITHGGESVGFVSQNTVYPDARSAVVVLTNGDFADAPGMITKAIADVIMPRALPADSGEAPRTDDAKAEFAALAAGRWNPAHFTDHARFYFTDAARADYAASLGALGTSVEVKVDGSPRLRGGFVNRNFTVTVAKQKLEIVTYAEPGEHGRWEQFIVMPGGE